MKAFSIVEEMIHSVSNSNTCKKADHFLCVARVVEQASRQIEIRLQLEKMYRLFSDILSLDEISGRENLHALCLAVAAELIITVQRDSTFDPVKVMELEMKRQIEMKADLEVRN